MDVVTFHKRANLPQITISVKSTGKCLDHMLGVANGVRPDLLDRNIWTRSPFGLLYLFYIQYILSMLENWVLMVDTSESQ